MEPTSADPECPAFEPNGLGDHLPGTATDALVCASMTVRERHAGYTVVRCPGNPAFWFGNMLVLDSEPPAAQYDVWFARHGAAFAGVPVQRRVVTWEVPSAARLFAFHAGDDSDVTRQCSTVFAARRAPARGPGSADIRRLESDADWSRLMYDPAEHEPLAGGEWDARTARDFVVRIVREADAAFDPQRRWPLHPKDDYGQTVSGHGV